MSQLPSAELLSALNRASIEVEVMAEKAASLGHHGRQVEKALAALTAFDAAPGRPEERRALLTAAAREVWKYFVQREACGMRNHREAIALYSIPQDVLARLGAM